MALATQETIRDRIYTLIESLTPTSLSSTKFRRFRNEEGADFVEWAQKNATGAFRRFQVREVGDDEEPVVSNMTEERVILRVEILIAYPTTHRYGPANAMDRDDVANSDYKLIKHIIGREGRANFSNTDDCTPLGSSKTRDSRGTIDFSVIRAEFEYLRETV